jgi:RNA polymerase sigma-70 factor (ECF subfamily)
VRREQPVSEPPAVDVDASQFDHVARGQLRHTLETLLDRLDADKRAVIVLFEIEELSMKEVAEVLGCPVQTAYSRLHAARKILLNGLQDLKSNP